MSSSQPTLDPTALQSLLALVRAQSPHPDVMTLAEAEAAVMTVLRQIGPPLLQATLAADKPSVSSEGKKGHRRSAVERRCASADGDRARSRRSLAP
jgi:hypothetical protein